MTFDVSTKIRLNRLEQELKSAIQNGEYPFLGHYSYVFYELVENSISQKFKSSSDPLAFFFRSLESWPAAFATYLVRHVAEGFGARGNHEVYPFIESALSAQLSLSDKEKLWSSFRRVILQLGLSPSSRRSGSNYMVEEYLRQAGVPVRYVGELAVKMYAYAESVGLPEDDDPTAILLWQNGLKHHIRYLPKAVQRAIEADNEGFYTRLFLKILTRQNDHDETLSEIEKLISSNVQNVANKSNAKRKNLAIPKVLFRDCQLGVELPAGEEALWRIDLDGVHYDHAGTLEAKFVPLDSLLPSRVSISNLKVGACISADLWEDDRNNRLMVFSSTGLLAGKGHLGQQNVLLLEPGDYELLLRFEPTGHEYQIDRISDEPELFHCYLSLDPSQEIELKRGPAKILLRADTKPVLVWEGQKYRGIQGNELYASEGLSIEARIPEELLFDKTVSYFITLNPGPLGETIDIPVKTNAGHFKINLADYSSNWSPGLTRLLVELKRTGFHRAETRSAINFWNGLKEVKNRTQFICTNLPSVTNLLEAESDNIKIDHERKIVTFRNEDQRLFRMIFQATHSRKQPFTWTVPGIFMQLLNYEGQELIEKPLKKESTLAISTRSREILEIYSSNNGTLKLGDFSQYVDFDRTGRKRIHLSGLVDYLSPGNDKLLFINQENQVEESLARFVAPHQILEFKVERKIDKYVLHLSTKNEIEEISLSIKDLIAGWKSKLTISCNSTEIYEEGSFSVYFCCGLNQQDSTYSHELQFFLENWPNGAWVISLNGKINGRWGRFSNARGDHYIVGIPVVGNTLHQSSEIVWDYIANLSLAQKESILKRLHRKLLNCYASEAWEEVRWMGSLWEKLTDDFSEQTVIPQRIITLAEERYDDSNTPSWVPMFSLISKFPKIYSQLGSAYRNLPNPRQLLSLKCLAILGEMKYGVLPLIFDQTLNNMLGGAFSNAAEMQQGNNPRNFSLVRYQTALKLEDVSTRLRLLRQHEWQPGDGDYLGALHYLFVSEQLVQAFRASMTGNEYRRGKALALCRAMNLIPLPGAPAHLVTGPCFLNLSNEIYDEEYQASVEEDHLHDITRFISQYARACRWETRKSGTLERVHQKAILHLGSKEDVGLALSYLLLLGKDLFMFYLLLWETAFRTDADHQEGTIYVRK